MILYLNLLFPRVIIYVVEQPGGEILSSSLISPESRVCYAELAIHSKKWMNLNSWKNDWFFFFFSIFLKIGGFFFPSVSRSISVFLQGVLTKKKRKKTKILSLCSFTFKQRQSAINSGSVTKILIRTVFPVWWNSLRGLCSRLLFFPFVRLLDWFNFEMSNLKNDFSCLSFLFFSLPRAQSFLKSS